MMDWTGCEFVEEVPGRCSGVPTIRGTRIFPETVLQYSNRGASIEEILEDFPRLRRMLSARYSCSPVENGQLAS